MTGDNDLQPVRFLFLAKGFSRVFWGLLIAMILFFGNASVEVFHFVRVPAYIAGSALVAWGLWMLSGAGAVGAQWRTHVRMVMALVFLQVYFAPFFEWWKMSPHVLIYLANVLGLLLVSMLALFWVNVLAADVFRRLSNRGGQIEAWVFAGSVILLMIAPLVLTVIFCLVAALRYQTEFEFEIWQTVVRLPIWVYMILTIPCSLTLIVSWKVKELCYGRLAEGDREAKPTHG
ncbi:MAG: hypothetical protein KKE37_04970 [Verrucomicrobia bacterium]|nr:hypothetical protein [Verrucomicrobiota bacterium]MBU4289814.1 hypothetical protein [Verrucomicrobiota bacterium]MBU4428690.1 hypothetical protein [Verrucomicrobiota bacterium]MCG2681032.1 hypothetical protein [Kiritimatiellia bacterium]